MNGDEQLEQFKMRLDCVHESQRRSRLAFFTSIVISLGIMFSCFNAYFSWYRNFAFKSGFDEQNAITKYLQEQVLSEWVSSRMFVLPFLGIKAGPSDASIIGGVTLFVTATWFFYAIRRENHTIGTLLIDAKDAPKSVRDIVFHVIASRMVFTTISGNDQPIASLAASTEQATVPMIRRAVHILMYFPLIAIALIISLDLFSFVLDSPFRPEGTSPSNESSVYQKAHHITVNTIALILSCVIGFICHTSVRFEKATGKVLREFSGKLGETENAT